MIPIIIKVMITMKMLSVVMMITMTKNGNDDELDRKVNV